MGRKVVRLRTDHLTHLPGGCGSCLFWELDPVRRGRVADGEASGTKEAWVARVLREWGPCGSVALVDDVPVGWAVWAPPALVPGAAAFPTAPVSPDAVLLATAYVDPAQRGGLGRLLVQAMARDLVSRGGICAVEAFGRRDARPVVGVPVAGCVLPAGFLEDVGFGTQRPHGSVPRMRMELRSALTWRDGVGAAVGRLVGAVTPVGAPRPTRAGRVGRAVTRADGSRAGRPVRGGA